jgi:hypothetical protein
VPPGPGIEDASSSGLAVSAALLRCYAIVEGAYRREFGESGQQSSSGPAIVYDGAERH